MRALNSDGIALRELRMFFRCLVLKRVRSCPDDSLVDPCRIEWIDFKSPQIALDHAGSLVRRRGCFVHCPVVPKCSSAVGRTARHHWRQRVNNIGGRVAAVGPDGTSPAAKRC